MKLKRLVNTFFFFFSLSLSLFRWILLSIRGKSACLSVSFVVKHNVKLGGFGVLDAYGGGKGSEFTEQFHVMKIDVRQRLVPFVACLLAFLRSIFNERQFLFLLSFLPPPPFSRKSYSTGN